MARKSQLKSARREQHSGAARGRAVRRERKRPLALSPLISPESLRGRVAWVTGAGSGLGRAAALLLAQAGARVAAFSLSPQEVQATRAAIIAAGGEAIAQSGDVANAAAVNSAAEEIKETWGRLDVVMVNAGINGVWAPLEKIEPDEWDQTLQVNLRGTFLTVRAALPLLKVRGGSVIVMSSVNGTRIFSNTGATAYSASKAGQLVMARMTALELAPYKIRVNTICPGAITTNIGQRTVLRDVKSIAPKVKFEKRGMPLTQGEPGHPEQVAELVWFLACDLSSHITGTEVFIDGGESLLRG